MNRPFRTYNGGKNADGVFQNIINEIPPHEIFISAFAGNCGILANKKKAAINIAIDLDKTVIEAWSKFPDITALNEDSTRFLTHLFKCYPQQQLSQIFVFADPPYLMEVRTGKKDYYKHEMTSEAAHKNLLAAMVELPVKVLITHYPCKLYDDMLKGWRYIDIAGMSRRGRTIERLYMNYPAPTELHDYSFFGKNARQREKFKKAKKNMLSKFQRMSLIERNFIMNDAAVIK